MMCRVRLRKNPKLIDWVLHGRPGQVAKLACSPQANGKVTLAGSTFIVLARGTNGMLRLTAVCAVQALRGHDRPSRLTPVVLPVQH
jgi:hypothetical protein